MNDEARKKLSKRIVKRLAKRISQITDPYGMYANNPKGLRRALMRYLESNAIRDAEQALGDNEEPTPSTLDIC